MRGRILYVQYTNPAFYPPLEHSSQILAEGGWDVTFLGVAVGDTTELAFPPHPRIRTRLLPACRAGFVQKLHYMWYCAQVLAGAIRDRPHWVYASDQSSTVPALLAATLTGARVIYHEHDSPPPQPRTLFDRLLRHARRRLCRRSAACVLPSTGRISEFIDTTGTDNSKVFCVWNCPRTREAEPVAGKATGKFLLYYHGSINRERLPSSIIDALEVLPPQVHLRIIGYETLGSRGYGAELMERAALAGVADRIEYAGTVRTRGEMLDLARECHLGLSFMPPRTDDVNMNHMAGASNKPFDYLACGMALLVSDIREWREMFVTPGYALACDPADVQSLSRAVSSLIEDPDAWADMARKGREKVLSAWNYELQFAPLLALLDADARGRCAS
jgi:glycosyltransferase involved in cell wall biosynthesis